MLKAIELYSKQEGISVSYWELRKIVSKIMKAK